jgi:hypothetical protein
MNVCKSLTHGWSFTQVSDAPGVERATKDGEWLPTQEFPTTVHVELLKLKKIPDPVRTLLVVGARLFTRCSQFIGLHEWDVQCAHFVVLLLLRHTHVVVQGSERPNGHSRTHLKYLTKSSLHRT